MSHELEIRPDGIASMAYAGETPWHKQGTKVEGAMTAEQAITSAGLDWAVNKVPIYIMIRGKISKVEDKIAIVRETDHHVLSVMTPNYEPVQNRDAFKFFDNVVNTKEAKYDTAGSLRGGRQIWVLAKVNGGNGTISIKGDAVDKYLLLMNGHDGTSAVKMFFTPVRVVCMNTLAAAIASAIRAETFYSRHTGDIQGRMEKAREILGITLKYYEGFEEVANSLAAKQLSPGEMPKLLAAAFGTTGSVRPEDVIDIESFSKKRQEEMVKVQRLFEGEGKGLDEPGIRGTKWAAYNSVVEYVDYERQYRGDNADDNRLQNTWLGTGIQIKNRAWSYLTSK